MRRRPSCKTVNNLKFRLHPWILRNLRLFPYFQKGFLGRRFKTILLEQYWYRDGIVSHAVQTSPKFGHKNNNNDNNNNAPSNAPKATLLPLRLAQVSSFSWFPIPSCTDPRRKLICLGQKLSLEYLPHWIGGSPCRLDWGSSFEMFTSQEKPLASVLSSWDPANKCHPLVGI